MKHPRTHTNAASFIKNGTLTMISVLSLSSTSTSKSYGQFHFFSLVYIPSSVISVIGWHSRSSSNFSIVARTVSTYKTFVFILILIPHLSHITALYQRVKRYLQLYLYVFLLFSLMCPRELQIQS